jgi:hypothetical protein
LRPSPVRCSITNRWVFAAPLFLSRTRSGTACGVLPAHVNVSEWHCTVENRCLRLGLRYVRGLRVMTGQAIAAGRPFLNIDELARHVPQIRKDELEMLAGVGALMGWMRNIGAMRCGRQGEPAGPLDRCSRWSRKPCPSHRWQP